MKDDIFLHTHHVLYIAMEFLSFYLYKPSSSSHRNTHNTEEREKERERERLERESEESKMGSFSSESESRVWEWNPRFIIEEGPEAADSIEFAYSNTNPEEQTLEFADSETDPEDETLVYGFKQESKMKKKKTKQVFLEGYVEAADEDDLMRTKSLTDEDLDELKGCLDLGFGFSYEEIPELCNTLPALELCYSMSQKLQKSPESPPAANEASSPASGPIANWRISSPGDHPEEVKARLKFWAQTVACTVKLCS